MLHISNEKLKPNNNQQQKQKHVKIIDCDETLLLCEKCLIEML